MKLCEHLTPLYQNEMRHGNRPLFVSTPKYVDESATANIYVHMQNKLLQYEGNSVRSGTITDYHFPSERYYYCPICNHYLSGPLEDNQTNSFEHSKFDTPNDKIVATMENINIEDGFYAKFIVPVERKEN